MRISRPRSGVIIVTMFALATLGGTFSSAFAAEKSASATLQVRINVVPTVNNAAAAPKNADSGINFAGFGPSTVHNSVEIRPLPPQLLRDIPLKTNRVGAPQAPPVLQTTTIVLQ